MSPENKSKQVFFVNAVLARIENLVWAVVAACLANKLLSIGPIVSEKAMLLLGI